MAGILITGAYGFVGKNLSVYLDRGSVHNLFALDVEQRKPDVYKTCFSWDHLESINWNEIDAVIHLAGIAHDTSNNNDSQIYYDINVGLTKAIYDRFLDSPTRKFIYFSSVKAVADSIDSEILTEDHATEPTTVYGKSKLDAEKYLLSQPKSEGKELFILRPCMIHGPGNKGNLNLLYNVLKRGIPYPLGAFDNLRSFVSIENLSFVIELLIQKHIEPGIYQIADSDALSTLEIVEIFSEGMNKKVRIWKINRRLIRYLAKVGDLLHLPFNTSRLNKLTENYQVSNQKLTKALSCSLPVSSREGLLRTIQSFSSTSSNNIP